MSGGADSNMKAQTAAAGFWWVWSGQAASLLGSGAVQFALIWWLTVETQDARVLALATMVGLLPQVLLGPLIGVLVDRWNRKRILLLSDFGVALASAVLAFLFARDIAEPVHVLGLLLVRAIGSAFHRPAMMASTTLMVADDHLPRIQGLNQALQGLLTIASPPAGAFLVVLLSMSGVMWIDVWTALLALVPLLLVSVPQPRRSAREGALEESFTRDLMVGLRFLKNRLGLLILVLMSAAINLSLVPAFSLLPLLVKQELKGNALDLAWLSSALGLGLLSGGILVGFWNVPGRNIFVMLGGLAGLGLAVSTVGLVPISFLSLLATVLAVGLCAPFVNGPVQVILQRSVPAALQGRVFALMGSLAGLTAPLGLVLAGSSVGWLGLRGWYIAGGASCLAMVFLGSLSRPLLQVEETTGMGDSLEPR